jgi:hypothetical protein
MDELFWLAVIKVSGYFSTELLRLESEKKSKNKKDKLEDRWAKPLKRNIKYTSDIGLKIFSVYCKLKQTFVYIN